MSPHRHLLNRRSFLTLGTAAALASAGASSWIDGSSYAAPLDLSSLRPVAPARITMPSLDDRHAYESFRQRFISPEGRVVDTYNGGVSHSEGQGWGMLMAVAFDDPETFDRLRDWTRLNLRRATDRLHAWRFHPNSRVAVPDTNNATDGDLYIAGALARGGRLWRRPELEMEAAAIGRDILRLLVRRVGSRVVLLPAAYGFERDGIVVNLSYYAFPLMREVARAAPSPLWAALEDDGVQLIEEGRFGVWGLPPDWMRIDPRTGALSPAPGWPARFSYDAIRIPLHLAWARAGSPGMSAAFARYWSGPHPFAPAWVDLRDGSIAPYPAETGTRAVAHAMLHSGVIGAKPSRQERIPQAGPADHYYSAALVVLSRIAVSDHYATS